jgi:hypothetical protein
LLNQTGCLGAENAYQLNEKTISIVDGFSMGSVDAHFLEIAGGEAIVKWTQFQPYSELIPVNDTPLEIISTFL